MVLLRFEADKRLAAGTMERKVRRVLYGFYVLKLNSFSVLCTEIQIQAFYAVVTA